MADLSQYSDDELMQVAGLKGGQVPKSENILQRAASSVNPVQQAMSPIMNAASPNQVGYSVGMGTAPQDMGGFLASKFLNQPQNVGGVAPQAEGNRETEVNKIQNPLARFGANIATDPMTYGALGEGAAKTAEGTGNVLQNVGRMASSKQALKFSNQLGDMVENSGSKLSGDMGSAMDAAQASKPDTRISFLDEMTRPQMDSKVTKLVNKTDNLHLYDLDKLTLPESQQVVSDLKANLRQSLKSGDLVKSDERNILGFINELKTKQLQAFPEHADILKNYGEGIEAYKDVSGQMPSMIEGGGNRIQRAAQEQSLQKTSPEAYEQFKGYQNTKKGVNFVKNATGLGTAEEIIRRKFLGG